MPDSGPVTMPDETPPPVQPLRILFNILFGLALVYLLVTSVGMVGSGFKWASGGKDAAQGIFAFATNPLAGLILGTFATALVQSSSTVSSVIVGLVLTGQVPVPMAIPMIMGANIGTTVTNTIVSLGHITRPQEFRRAFAAATIHDAFNFMAVAIFLPIELICQAAFGSGPLAWLSTTIAAAIVADPSNLFEGDVSKRFNFMNAITGWAIDLFYHHDKASGTDGGLLAGLGNIWGGIMMIGIAIAMVFTSILALGRHLRKNLTGRAERLFHRAVGRGPVSGIASGTIVTIMVQSSSTTTSLIIPMAGAGLMRLEQVFPFTLGANIGTTVTALLASMAVGADPQAGLAIALAHFFFNGFAMVLIYGVPALRRIPLAGARWLADLALRNRGLAIAYILVVYFVVPLLVLGIMHIVHGSNGAPAATTHDESLGTLHQIHDPSSIMANAISTSFQETRCSHF